MALYVSAGRRARRTAVIAVVAAVVALAVGWAIGRNQVPSIDDRVAQVSADGRDIATRLERLDIEYRQAVDGEGDSLASGVLEPLRDERAALQHTMDRAPWIRAATRARLLDALADVETVAQRRVAVAGFRARLDAAGELIRSELGGGP
jgi:hypothetical protein